MREAEALAESLDDQRRLGQISAYLSGYFVQAGDDPIQAIEKGERAFAIASAIGDFGLQVQANHFLASSYHAAPATMIVLSIISEKMLRRCRGDQIYDRFGLAFLPSVGARYQLVLLLAERGEFAEAAVQGAEAVRIAEIANHPFSLCTAYFGVG